MKRIYSLLVLGILGAMLTTTPTTIHAATMAVEEVNNDALVVTVSEFNNAEVSTTVWYKLTGTVKNLKDGDQYGNFDLEDETGSVYVYGLLSEKGGAKKKFQELAAAQGITNGSKITIIGNRGVYNEKIEVLNAYFVSNGDESEENVNEVLTVTYNNSSTISYGQYTGTLEDGTVLGFYVDNYYSYAYFCGAITSATSVVVPEKVSYNGKEYNVNYFGYNSGYIIDFDEAPNVTSLTLPSVLTYIYNYVPSSVSELHLLGTIPPRIYSSGYISSSTTVFVPKSAYGTYQNYCNNGNNGWSTSIDLKFEGWELQSYTVTVNTPGTFGNILLQTVEQWTDVNELTVIGHLNEDDLKLLTRLKLMTKLDLTQTDITVITGCSGLSYLKEVLLPSTVIEIGSSAFSGCSRLKEISAPNATIIGSQAFYYCSSLTTVSLPAATEIGSYAFPNCSSLTTVSLPAATEIGSYAFDDCRSLTTVSLPAATEIGSYAFEDCSSLTTVSLPAATEIGSYAFEDCSSLTTVSLPACLTSLRNDAFSRCSKLADVYCYVVAPLTTTAFSNSASSATLHVPALSLTSYMLHDSWYSFYKIVPIEGTIERLTIYNAFTISDLTGLAEKTDLSVIADIDFDDDYGYSYIKNHYEGHLNVTTNSKWTLGDFVQSQTNLKQSSSYDNNYSYYYSTMIPYNEISADNVTIKYWPYKNTWNFFTLPFDVNVSDIIAPEGSLWVIRKYSGDDRARMTGNTWQNMTNGMTLKAGEGYILHYNNDKNNSKDWFIFKAIDNSNKNNIFAYQDVIKQLSSYASDLPHNRNWNLVGNPYPCYYDTRSIEHNGVITVWNGSGYTAYSLLDDDYVLRPNEAFFVQCPIDATSMTFKAEGRRHTYDNSSNGYNNSRSSQRNANNVNKRLVYNLTLTGNDFTDRARLVINPDAKMDYEITCDASKFMSDDSSVPQLYVLDNGIRYAIDERPLGDGVISLGARFGNMGEYTIALKNGSAEGDKNVILTDNVTGNQVNLAEDTYTFSAQAGTHESRFSLTLGSEITGISQIENEQMSNESTIYDLQGRRIKAQQQKGIYIVKKNGKSRKVLK